MYGEEQAGEFRMSRSPRAFMRDCYGESASDFALRVGDPVVVAQMAGVLWEELLKPCAVPARDGRREPRPESLAVWQKVCSMMPSLADELKAVCRSEQASCDAFLRKRMKVVDCFEEICKRSEFQECIVERLISSIGLTDDFAEPCASVPGSTKMDVLFSDLQEARPLRQSVVESLGVSHFEALSRLVGDVIGATEGDMDTQPLFAFGAAIEDARASALQDLGKRKTRPPPKG